MSWSSHSAGSETKCPPTGDNGIYHPPMMEDTTYPLSQVSSSDDTQVFGVFDYNTQQGGRPYTFSTGPTVAVNDAQRVRRRDEAEFIHGEEDDYGDYTQGETTFGEFGLRYNENEENDELRRSPEDFEEVPEYPMLNDGLVEPMRARNRSGPPIPPPVPVKPGQLFFSNQIWTRLNVEQQTKLGALKVGSKNKSFKTRPWLVVQTSSRVDADGQQMLWVMCCTTRNRSGWEGVTYRDSKSFIPMAPTPSRFGRPVLPLVSDERDVFLGGSLLFLEVFKEVKVSLLGDYIGYISDESVKIVNFEQARIAEERRKKDESRAAYTAALKARGGGRRRGHDRNSANYDLRGGNSGPRQENDGWITPNPIPPFHLPAMTYGTYVSAPLNPKAPAFRDPTFHSNESSRGKQWNGRGSQNRHQSGQGQSYYHSHSQAPSNRIHGSQNYGGRDSYGGPSGYNNSNGSANYGDHESSNGNYGHRRRVSNSIRGGHSGDHSYRSQQSGGHPIPVNPSNSGRGWQQGVAATQQQSQGAGSSSGWCGNHGLGSGGYSQGGIGWVTPRRDQRR
ncbi:hypothetical protein L873DRAFT_1792877 [Choiromyces venosus 120613-1]|uniref:Uncharacterized protein n=1 Tax=Choiromyces venosus 120613-1 TaxID=1336337 RepID=A0A3N4JD68_9PEZI|nr:hypothetical protein L873DRAFT_1792877 [Choiromyces venosus 120613-1]